MNEIDKLQKEISRKFGRTSDYLPFISEIRFPNYKALKQNLKIDLNWPVTALVGPNGSNKSSILQAISAAPYGRSLSDFWFSTDVDVIATSGSRGAQRFIYKYIFDEKVDPAECRKARVTKKYRQNVPSKLRGKYDPDYWEPTKAVAVDGMEKIPSSGFNDFISPKRDRWLPIVKNVTYIDSRTELSAFDKYLHHQSFEYNVKNDSGKRFKLVVESKNLAKVLAGQPVAKVAENKILTKPELLSREIVNDVSEILGKEISEIVIVRHKLFRTNGFTVKFKLRNSDFSYSEAHAGSGEFAAVRLVEKLHRAENGSLVLLDEPEISLHPGAQVQLMKFLLQLALRKSLQIVISTHSPTILECLPFEAVKVLGFDSNSEEIVLLADGCSVTEAFVHLGFKENSQQGKRVVVEDSLAKLIVETSIMRTRNALSKSIEVVAVPGGADGIVKNVVPAFAISNENSCGVVLDGDQRPTEFDPEVNLSAIDLRVAKADDIGEIWKSRFHGKTIPTLYPNSDGSGKVENFEKILKWSHDHLGFLPGGCPESLVARSSIPDLNLDEAASDTDSAYWKEFWRKKYRDDYHLKSDHVVTEQEVFELQKSCIYSMDPDDELFKTVSREVLRILNIPESTTNSGK